MMIYWARPSSSRARRCPGWKAWCVRWRRATIIDGLKLKPAQAESLEQLLDEHEVHDLATAQILDAEDFKEIGIKVGTRKKLLERLASSTSEA